MIELGVIDIREKIKKKELTSAAITKAYIDEIKKQSHLNAVIEIFDDAIKQAETLDRRLEDGFAGKLAGVPIIIKDNILMKGRVASAGSRILSDYVAEYNSTVVVKLLQEGAVIIGRSNMDEFAMGSGTETSYYGKTLNPYDNTRVPGGSSGGSAAAVAANLCAAALGTDTGGSVRQPSAYCGVIGIKPTYGRVSRYGVIAFASSLDQVGPITKTVADNALLLEVLSGSDNNDETSLSDKNTNFSNDIGKDIRGLKVGIINSVNQAVKGMVSEKNYLSMIEVLKGNGADIISLDIENMDMVLPIYYIIAPAEAASNLARYDGVKYTFRDESAKNLEEIYRKSRTKGFGDEVKRRIMLGNYVLSSGYFDAYYNKAKSLQSELKDAYTKAFEKCDIILMPTTIGEAFKLGEKSNPIDAYKEDIFTVSANVTGLPSISVPYGTGVNGLPIGVQFIAPAMHESKLYQIADFVEKIGRGQK